MDDITALLAVQLQLQDVNEFLDRRKGKEVEGSMNEADEAFKVYKTELQRQAMTLSDRRMGLSIAQAVETDAQIISTAEREEDRASHDHQCARALAEGHSLVPTSGDLTESNSDHENFHPMAFLNRASKVWNLFDSEDNNIEASSSSTYRESAAGPAIPKKECIVCQERKYIFDVLDAPCQHIYCRSCVSSLFAASTTDESLFPARCCRQNIPLSSAQDFLSDGLIKTYKEKEVEFRAVDRTYCSVPACSTFIPPARIAGDSAYCPKCNEPTCTMCKAAEHSGDCPEDKALQQLLTTAAEAGWQRCYACRRMVELNTGCNHITCPCGVQFCYVCGERWKTCQCPQWDEERLLNRAEQIVARAPAPRPPQNALQVEQNRNRRQQVIQQELQNLRERHDCEHQSWRYVRGSHACEECHDTLPQFIWECAQCHVQFCRRCRNNRL